MTVRDESDSPQDVWERNNESFQYDPPDKSPELWSSEEFTELWDRMIMRQVRWECSYCNQPLGSLKKARRHVQKQHSEALLSKYAPMENDDGW